MRVRRTYSQIICRSLLGKGLRTQTNKRIGLAPRDSWALGNKTRRSGSNIARGSGMRQAGSRSALQQLVDDHYAALYRYAYRLSCSPDRANDLTQETFCKAQAQLAQLREPSRAKAWLYSILRNAYLHRVRSEKQHREISLEWAENVAREAPEPPPDIDPQLLQAALDEMPEGFRTPLILFYFKEFSYRGIAEQ